MKSRVARLILIALTLTFLENALCYNYGRAEDPSAKQGLDHLKDKEEVLTNEKDKFYSVISYEISKEDQGESAHQPGVTVLEVRREEEGEMIRFTVKYVSPEETVEARWAGVVGGYKDFSGINTALGNGVYETSVLFPRPVPEEGSSELRRYQKNPDWVGIYLDLPDETFFMMLNVTTEKAVDREIPSLRLAVEPAGDFVYHEGEEFSFKIRIPLSVKENGSLLYLTATHLDPRTGEVTFTPDGSFIDIDGVKQFPNYHEVPARIKGTENGASGVIIPSLWFHNLKGVVSSVQRARTVVLRPSTEEVPFPDGFLAFVVDPNYGGPAGEEVICRLGEVCYYICRAAGSDITDITMTWIKADGTYQNLDSTLERSKTPYLKKKAVYFHVDYVPEETEKIRCVVETANGKLISKEATLVVSTPVDIIAEESGIVLICGAEDAASRHLEVSCTVTGSPRPNVTFRVGPYYDRGNDQPADDVIERGNNKYTMIKTLTYDTEHVHNMFFTLRVTCKAMPTEPYYPSKFYTMIYKSNGCQTVKLPVSSRFDSDQLCCIRCRRLHSMENFID